MGAASQPTLEAARAVYLLSEAEKLAAAFNDWQLPFLFVKGIALLATVYPDPQMRPLGDIDMVIIAKDIGAVTHMLKELGYEWLGGLDFAKTGALWSRVDLHFGIPFFDADRLWQTAQTCALGNQRILIPSPEYLWLHAFLHPILQDGKISQTAYRDGEAILRFYQKEWSWERCWQLIRKEGWTRAASLFVSRFSNRYPVLVSNEILHRVLHPRSAKSREKWERRLLCPSTPSYWRMILAQDRGSSKVRLLFQVLFPSLEFLKLRYPRCPYWLLPLARPVILTWKSFRR